MIVQTSPTAEHIPRWTQDESVAYESAREMITDLIGICSHQLAMELEKPEPDLAQLALLRSEQARLFRERTTMRFDDAAQISRICEEYGPVVRSWYASTRVLAA